MIAPFCKIIDDLASAPLLERHVSGQRRCRGTPKQTLCSQPSLADQNVRASAHAAADKHRLTVGTQRRKHAARSAWVGTSGPAPLVLGSPESAARNENSPIKQGLPATA